MTIRELIQTLEIYHKYLDVPVLVGTLPKPGQLPTRHLGIAGIVLDHDDRFLTIYIPPNEVPSVNIIDLGVVTFSDGRDIIRKVAGIDVLGNPILFEDEQ